tara:strand:- start:35 stop:784 length:750 start_codon:yes stop_codon:yes gene_type:complete
MQSLRPATPGGSQGSTALAVSGDGLVIVGVAEFSAPHEVAFRWTEATGLVPIDDHGPEANGSAALAVNGDGSVAVGYMDSSIRVASIWDETHGMRDLNDVLVNDFNLDLAGWSLSAATGISADGLVITGMGRSPSGESEGWIAIIDEPNPVPVFGDLDHDGFVGINDLNIILTNWNQFVPPGDILGDVAGVGGTGPDGYIGIDDLNVVLGNWNAGVPPSDNSVPEPTVSILVGLYGLIALQYDRRGKHH